MTKEEILQEFSDINNVYNNCTRHDTLKHMLDELTEPNTGHWISHYDEDAKEGWYECGRCHTERALNTKFCPDCGCRMVEPQESEK